MPALLKRKRTLLLLLTLLYWGTRLPYYDSDLPAWKNFYYSQVDELFYSIGAFKIAEPAGGKIAQYAREDNLPLTMFEDVVTAGSLTVFGDNYFGLRFPAMLMGYAVLILFCGLLFRRFGYAAAAVGGLLLLADPGFLLANRAHEPTIFRLFGMLLVMVFAARLPDTSADPRRFFMASLLGGAAFLFLYPTNFFVVAALLVCLLLVCLRQGVSGRRLLPLTASAVLALLICLAAFLALAWWQMGDLSRFTHMSDYSGRVVAGNEKGWMGTLRGLASNVKAIREASFFYFNPFMLAAGLVTLLFFIGHSLRSLVRKAPLSTDQVMLVFLLLFLAQTVFINDYPRKKLLMLFPFVVYAGIYTLHILSQRYSTGRIAAVATAVCLPVVITAAAVQWKYFYRQPTFHFREAMRSMNRYNGQVVAGNLSYAFRLYNSYTPVLNYYAYKYHDYEKHQAILREIAREQPFAGTIYYGDSSYVADCRGAGLCKAEALLPVNPSVPKLPVFMYRPCDSTRHP